MEEGPSDFAREVRVTFIRDEPAQEDFFKTHSRVAHAVAAAIRSNPQLRVIGLLGHWGSGKSTVVHHLKADLASGPDADAFHLFSYDAWLHQNDPVRRSFLESLYDHLIKEGLIDEKTWKPLLDELTGYVEKSEIEQEPVLTTDAKWIIGSILPLPFAIGLMSLDTIQAAWGEHSSGLGKLLFFSSAVLLGLPFLTMLVRKIINSRKKDSDGSAPFMPLLLSKTVEKTKSTTFRSPEPTSIEFGRAFQNVMKDVGGDNSRFVFVIDNLDRLAERDALQMWATIRSFFLLSDASEDVGYEAYHPVVVLPVDVHALEKMFALTEDEEVARELASSFINKTFDITFEVSEPVMSDWRDFLEGQFRKVFGNQVPNEQIYRARIFYEEYIAQGRRKITPREINKFVNRVATLYLQWHNEGIDFGVLAYYAIHSRHISDNLLRIITSADHPLSVVGNRWQEQIAAVYYGVPLEKAAQVVLDEPLREAISSFDEERFRSLSSVPGFGDTLKRIAESPPLGPASRLPQFKFVTNLALLLARLPEDGALWKRDSWRRLAQDFVGGEEPDDEVLDLSARLAALLPFVPNDLRGGLVSKSAGVLSDYLTANGVSGPFEDRISAASMIVDYAESHHLDPPIFFVDEAPKVFLTVLTELASRPTVWPRLRSTVPLEAAFDISAAMLRSSEDCDLVPPLVRVLSADGAYLLFGDGKGEPNWDIVRNAAAEILRNPAGTPNAVTAASAVLGALLAQDKTWELVEQLADDGTLQARLNDSYSDGRMEAVAAIAAFLIWRNDEFSGPVADSWRKPMDENPGLVGSIHAKIREFFGDNTIWDIWTSYYNARQSRPLLEGIIRYQIENDELGELNVKTIMDNMGWYKRPIPWRLERRFLEILERQGSLLERLQEAKADDNFLAAAGLVSRNRGESGKLGSLISDRIRSASVDDWKNAIESGGGVYELSVEFKPGDEVSFGVRSALASALKETTDLLLSTSDTGVRRRWFEMVAMLRPRAERQVLGNVGAAFLYGNKIQSPLNLLKAGGTALLKRGGFDAQPDLAIQRIVLPNALNRSGRAWLEAASKEIRSWILKAGANARQSLVHRLDRFEQSNSAERKYWAAAMRPSWT